MEQRSNDVIRDEESPEDLGLERGSGASPWALFWSATRLAIRWYGAAVLSAASLILPAAMLLGGLAWLTLTPLYPILFTWETNPVRIFDAFKPLQSHSLAIYSGLFGLGLTLMHGLVVPLARVALLVGYSSLAVGERVQPLEAWYRLVPIFRLMVETLWARAWRVALGTLLLGLPGLILALFYSQAELVMLLEGRSGPDALKRSQRWMEESLALARYLSIWILVWLVGWGFAVLWQAAWMRVLGTPTHFLSWTLRWSVPILLVLPLEAALSLLFYTDLQVRQQAFRRVLEDVMEQQTGGAGVPGTFHLDQDPSAEDDILRLAGEPLQSTAGRGGSTGGGTLPS